MNKKRYWSSRFPQTKKQVQEMVQAGYPICLVAGDDGIMYDRHCGACIKNYLLNK